MRESSPIDGKAVPSIGQVEKEGMRTLDIGNPLINNLATPLLADLLKKLWFLSFRAALPAHAQCL